MVNSSFIQIGDKSHIAFNVSQISYIQAENVKITDRNRASYQGYPHDVDKAYSIFIYMTTQRSMELLYTSEEIRDATFKKLLSVLNPLVISKPELVREADLTGPDTLKA